MIKLRQYAIVKAIFKNGSVQHHKVDFIDSEGYTVYRAFDLYRGSTHLLEEIVFVSMY